MNDTEILANAKYIFKPQAGPQTDFLSTCADVAIYGGAAGGGKTYAALLEALRHHLNGKGRVVFFRRQAVQILAPGGLWDESHKIFPFFGATSNQQRLEWTFPSGFEIKFAHLQNLSDLPNWGGAQVTVFLFDELTLFLAEMFWFMQSRNRSDAKIAGYIRATCNPPDGVNPEEMWVTELIDWYLTPEGLADKTKSGVIRWFVRQGNQTLWGSSPSELIDKYGVERVDCKSFTFIPATAEDNQILLQNNPSYLSSLRALNENDKNRLLYGNWRISSAGNLFSESDFKVFVLEPRQIDFKIIVCDTAQKVKEHNDYTVMQAWVLSDKGIYLVDQVRGRFEYPQLKMMCKSFINKHRHANKIAIEDAVSGTSLIQDLLSDGDTKFKNIIPIKRSKDKFTRARDCTRFISGGYVFVNPMADYYVEFMGEVTAFRGDLKHKHDDQVDCMMDAIDQLLINPPTLRSSATAKSYSNRIV